MSSIEVLAPGLLTTVQDLGREGYGAMGVSPSGAADALSLRVGNRLAGNAENTAALEMTLLGGTFRFPEGGIVAIAGSDFGVTIDGAVLPVWQSVEIHRGQTLRSGLTQSGARCYLCVRGGIMVEPFLGSASTHLLSGTGGHQGRALKKGDVLTVGSSADSAKESFLQRTIDPIVRAQISPRKTLRVTPGPQSDWFEDAEQELFYRSTYRVSEDSNRMGLRLEGPSLAISASRQMISEGVPLGAIQIPANGQPIILFVEQQTAGGYPKIASVIAADMHSVGQLRPRDEIRFERCAVEQARALLRDQEDLLASPRVTLE